jgi:hypothetical protein
LLVGFTDFDLANDPYDKSSTATYVLSLGFGPITWDCKKQYAFLLYSLEEEYLEAFSTI